MSSTPTRPSVFISYSHKDRSWLKALETMLAPAVRAGVASVWWDGKIKPSQIWRQEIDKAMASAEVAVLLVSPDFLASDFIQNEELPFLVEAAQQRGVKLLWALVSPCLYEYSPLQRIQATHDLARPLSKLKGADRQAALTEICRTIIEALGSSGSGPDASRAQEQEGRPLPHNLPYPRLGDLFTGRNDELQALEKDLETNGAAAITQTEAISGLGGIGKTRLAVEHAWRCRNRYTATWFVRADSPEGLRRNLAALAGPDLLNLPEWESQKETEAIAAVRRWLQEHSGWLMIFDNVDTLEAAAAVLEILPALSERGRILITSRLGNWPPEVKSESLHKLSSEEAVQFLLQRTNGKREPVADDAARATDLAKLVDGLPLALEQSAAYIVRHRMRFADYLHAWERERTEVLKWYDPLVMRYPASVAVTWKHTFDRLSPTPAALLRLTAFLAPDPIPVAMFEQEGELVKKAAELFREEVGTTPDGKTIREALADLADYSLMTRQDGGTLVVHRMVQEVLRSQIPEKRQRNWIEVALRIVNDAAVDDPSDVRTWPLWDRLRPHVAEIVVRAEEVGIVEPTSRLMGELGALLWAKSLYFEAEPLLRRALSIDEHSLDPKHPKIATRLNNLAQLLLAMNRLKEAEALIRRALSVDEDSVDSQRSDLAIRLNNLAHLLLATNRHEEAEPLMRRALSIDEDSFGSQQHPRISIHLNNLAQVLTAKKRLEEAEPLMRRALAIDESYFGPQNPEVATDLNNLALLLQGTNRLEEAELLMRRAVEVFQGSIGPEHPRTQIARENLELLLAQMSSTASSDDPDP